MTTTTIDQADGARPARMDGHCDVGLAIRARDVLRSEWTKLRSVRSTYWALIVAAAVSVAGSALAAFPAGRAGAGRASGLPDPVAFSFIGWAEYPVLAIGILGVLTFTSEYATGQIRTTFAAVPRRLAVLAAKTAVVAAVALVFGELLALASFSLTQAILSRHGRGVALSHPGVPGAVLAAGFALVVVAVTGVGLGAAIRHTAGAIAVLPVVFYLPLTLLALPAPWNHRIDRFTLPVAAYQVVALHPAANLLDPALSMLVLIGWPAVILAVAAVLTARRAP
jgi:ABC-2 type transport system permease protein